MMIDADKFYRDAETVTSFGEDWIHLSYKEFLVFFSSEGNGGRSWEGNGGRS